MKLRHCNIDNVNVLLIFSNFKLIWIRRTQLSRRFRPFQAMIDKLLELSLLQGPYT